MLKLLLSSTIAIAISIMSYDINADEVDLTIMLGNGDISLFTDYKRNDDDSSVVKKISVVNKLLFLLFHVRTKTCFHTLVRGSFKVGVFEKQRNVFADEQRRFHACPLGVWLENSCGFLSLLFFPRKIES